MISYMVVCILNVYNEGERGKQPSSQVRPGKSLIEMSPDWNKAGRFVKALS